MSIREKFVKQFGKRAATLLEGAARAHSTMTSANNGSDPFKFVLLTVIDFQCAEVDHYREYHGIKQDWKKLSVWIKAKADLGSHDGEPSTYVGLLSGAFTPYMKPALSPKGKP